ncbi:MAG: thioredoxin fold domain-containing protein [Betaproteobacteria bacterium]
MRILLLALALACAPAFAEDVPSWFTESLLHLPDDVADAAKEKKRVMLYFGQEGCPYCKRLMEVNFKQPQTVERMRRHFVALALNIWGDREVTWTDGEPTTEKQLAARLRVQFTPTLVFLDEKGEVALRLNGYYPPARFDAALDYVAGRLEKRLAFAEFMQDFDRRQPQTELRHEPFFLPPPADLRRRPGSRPLAVLFEGPNCAECEELHRVSLRRDAVLAELAKYDVARFSLRSGEFFTGIDGRKATQAGFAAALKVAHVPTLVLFDPGGREVLRLEAYFRPFHVAGALEYVSSGAWRREPQFQRFLQARAERLRQRGAEVDLWN